VSAFYGAAADVECGAIPTVNSKGLDGHGRADDVNDGVFRANLMKVDGLGIAIVNFAFGAGQQLEGFERECLSGRADGSAGNDLTDFGEAAMDVV
jgi:hypothetical protein